MHSPSIRAATETQQAPAAEGVMAPESTARPAATVWPLLAAFVEQLRLAGEQVRLDRVKELRRAMRENRLGIDPDVMAAVILDETGRA